MTGLPLILEPDEEDEDCALFLVDGTVAGRPYRFILDTGAALTQLEADDYTSELSAAGSNTSSGAFAISTEPVVSITDLIIGPLHAATLDVTRVEAIPGILRTLVGMDILGQHRCHFRLADLVMDVDPPLSTPAGAADLQIDSRGHFQVDVQWPGVVAHACWDTGSAPTIVNRDFWLAHQELFEEVGSSVGTDVTGTQLDTPVLLMAEAEIGGRRFSKHTAVSVDLTRANSTAELPMDMIIGYPTMRQANWLFDFPARRLAFTD
jgi:predicted aspartyl protease